MSGYEVEWLIKALTGKNEVEGCAAMERLAEESGSTDVCYPYIDTFAALLAHPNSLVRNRALALIAANAKWDRSDKINRFLEEILAHLTDEKPITARQCVKAAVIIAKAKPALAHRICAALREADVSGYRDSMRPLLEKDIADALAELEQCCTDKEPARK